MKLHTFQVFPRLLYCICLHPKSTVATPATDKLTLTMQKLQPRKTIGHRGHKRWPPAYPAYNYLKPVDDDPVEMVEAHDVQEKPTFRSKFIHYTLVFLKVALWIIFAWILSHLHLGAPCFLLVLTFWLYSRPMHTALKWAKRRLRG